MILFAQYIVCSIRERSNIMQANYISRSPFLLYIKKFKVFAFCRIESALQILKSVFSKVVIVENHVVNKVMFPHLL